MNNARTKSSFGAWTLVAILVALLYLISFGPACWISERTGWDGSIVSTIYQPVLQVAMHGPEIIHSGILLYSKVGCSGSCGAWITRNQATGFCRWKYWRLSIYRTHGGTI